MKAKFFAAARIIVGPPMSMFSITSCSVAPRRAAVGLERIEVHAHEVDELDLVLGGGRHVLRVVAQREQPGVELRVQGLDPPAHDLGEAREVLDRADLEPGLAQRGGRAARGDQLDAERREPARELDDARLVRHRQQRAPHPHLARLNHRLHRVADDTWSDIADSSDQTRRGWAGSEPDGAAGDQPHRLAVSSSCSIGRSASRTSSASRGLRQLDRALEDDRPGVDALVDEVDRDAEDLDPVVERLLDRARCPGTRAAAPDGR